MKYVTPPGQAAGSSYIDLDAATKTIGSPVIAAAIEHPMRELEAVIKGAGLTPNATDLTQVFQAVQKIAQGFVKAIGVLSAKAPLAVTNNGDLTGTVELSVATASETVAGVSERATDAEAAGGTDIVRHITPKHLKTGLDQKADKSHGHTVNDLSGILPIGNGGTGAATAALALTNLGAAPLASPTLTGAPTAPTAAAGTNTTQIATTAFVAAGLTGLAEALNKPGEVAYFAMSAPPLGWLKANGAAVSRTTYAALFAVIGVTYGAGNGSTTFNVPDLRGEFIRGWDDGRGIDAGRVFGNWQKGTLTAADGGPTGAVVSVRTSAASTTMAGQREAVGSDAFVVTDYATELVVGANLASAGVVVPGNIEGYAGIMRPRNIALLVCIKY